MTLTAIQGMINPRVKLNTSANADVLDHDQEPVHRAVTKDEPLSHQYTTVIWRLSSLSLLCSAWLGKMAISDPSQQETESVWMESIFATHELSLKE